MNQAVRNLEPKILWNHFADINEIPRPSKKEEKIIQYMKSFGEELGLETLVDKIGNVIIKKPGTKGYENKPAIIIQGHLDMVAQKNSDTVFDFEKDGIKMLVEGDWVTADGTTLGADNGIGVAAAMAVLSSTDIPHPPIEALFTIDEETGMTGAFHLESGLLDGKILLNLDSEDDKELTIGCAGGIDINIYNSYKEIDTPTDSMGLKLAVRGLKGGHSGMDIHKGRGNANKIMNRLLFDATKKFNIKVAKIDGGSLRNAIPRESFVYVSIKKSKLNRFNKWWTAQIDVLKSEYKTTDTDLYFEKEEVKSPKKVMHASHQKKLIYAIYSNANGIYRMSPDVDNLVQTSNNLARVLVENGKILIQNLCRSSVDTEKLDMAHSIESAYLLTGATVEMKGSYPGWAPDTKAPINKAMTEVFEMFNGFKPAILACHAGLECGIIKKAYPNVDMISFGPNIRGAHSPEERCQISSVAKFWDLVKGTLVKL